MDRQAIAEDAVDLWKEVALAYEKSYKREISVDVHISLFERAHTYIIHKNISEERSGVRPHSPQQEEDKPSEKQIKYAEDLGCKTADTMTRREISSWIEDNK